MPLLVEAQRCGRTDTIDIASFGTDTIEFAIDGFLNNNLADPAQGLCGVDFYFEHSYVYDFTVTVTSPAGQQLQLIGPENDQTRPPTNLARWFVSFTNCAEAPSPDPGAPQRWNNNDPFNWRVGSLYRGSYYPSGGCLDDLDTGPVNGTWTVSFNNTRATESGRGTFLLLTFCDDRHVEGPCCFADAGEPAPVASVERCTSDENLFFDFPPRYRRPRPDSAEYDYAYLIARDGLVVGVRSESDLSGFPAGNYEICGLSHRRGELGNLPVDGSFSKAELLVNLASSTPLLCAELTDECRAVTLYAPPPLTRLNEEICIGSSIRVGSSVYATTGIFRDTLVGRGGCDSIVELDLSVVDRLETTTDVVICALDTYEQGDSSYSISGTFVDTLTASIGCDSVSTINLTVLPQIITDTSAVRCAGDAFFIGTEAFTLTGNYQRIIPAANGCDSTVNLDLLVLDPRVTISAAATNLDCQPPSLPLSADTQRISTDVAFRWYNLAGDTTVAVTTDLAVNTGGAYIAELTERARGLSCTVRDTIIITDRRFDISLGVAGSPVPGDPPTTRPFTLDCTHPSLQLEALPQPSSITYTYEWSGPVGVTIPGPVDGRTLIVDAPGTYAVEATDPVTGCSRVQIVNIDRDDGVPSVTAGGNALLNCETTSITLSADTLQARSEELTYRWTGDCISEALTTPSITLDCPGTVRLSVFNTVSGCERDTIIEVNQDVSRPNLVPPATPPEITCFAPTQILDVAGSNSVNGLEYSWRNTADQVLGRLETQPVERAGTYRVSVFDSLSLCADSLQIIVAADTLPPVADAGPDSLSINCYTPSHTLGGSGTSTGSDFRYGWVQVSAPTDTLARTPELLVEAPGGAFDFTVFDLTNGCSATDRSRVLLQLDTPFIRLGLPLDFDCFVDSVEISAAATNLSFANRQQWSGPCLPAASDRATINVGCPGTYTYTVLNLETGCSATDSVQVELADNSVVAILPDTVRLDCDSGVGTIDRSAGTDAPNVSWFRDGLPVQLVGPRPRVTVPGIYTLVLGNFNDSCQDTATTVVVAECPVLAILIPPDSLTCDNSTVLLDANPTIPAPGATVEGEWLLPADAQTENGNDPRQLSVFSPGLYGYVVRNTVSGETDTAFVEVTLNREQPFVEAGPRDTITCDFPLATLDGSASDSGASFDYLWTSATGDTLGMMPMTTASTPGVYFLEVTNRGTGCSGVDNVNVFEDIQVPELDFSSVDLPCDTLDFPLAVIPDRADDYTYSWSGPAILSGAASDTVRLSAAGNYGVEVRRERNGCVATATASVRQLPCPPFPTLPDTSLTCRAETILLTATFRDSCEECTYQWSLNGEELAGELQPEVVVTTAGIYRIRAVNRFGLSGEATATVSDARVLPLNNAGPDRTLTCDSTAVTLGDGQQDVDFDFTYRWLTLEEDLLGTAASQPVSRTGEFVLETTNRFSGCVALDTVRVDIDTLRPIAVAGPSRTLDCEFPLRVLDGLASSTGPTGRYAYQWRSGNANGCLEGVNTLNPIVACGGTYELMVRDQRNGCVAIDQTEVIAVDELPRIQPVADATLTCELDSLTLQGMREERDNEVYRWDRVDSGQPILLTDQSEITLVQAGSYQFTVTDTLTNCTNSFGFDLTMDLVRPTVSIEPVDTFYCELDSLLVTGLGETASGRVPQYRWTSRTGFQVGDEDSATAVTYQPDVYRLEVTDPRNGCTALDSVVVLRDTEAPIPEAGRDTTLDCLRRSVRLIGSATTLSGQAEYSWSTFDGSLVSGRDGPRPSIDRAGRYLMLVTDPVNECSSADIVRVTEDTLLPMATIDVIGTPQVSCASPTVTLTAEGSSAASDSLTYRWSRMDGPEPSGPLIAEQLNVAAGGSYQVVVVDGRNGCQATATAVIPEDLTNPLIFAAPPASLSCERNEAELRVDLGLERFRFDYTWLDPREQPIGTGDAITVGNAGTYYLVSEDERNGCRDTTSVRVTSDVGKPTVVIADPAVLNCSRAFTTIDASESSRGADLVARWNSPGSTAVATADPLRVRGRRPGWYYLTVTNTENGCSTQDSVELTRSAVAIENFEIEVEQPACAEDRFGSVSIATVEGGMPPYVYSLDGGLFTDRLVYENLPIGSYTVEVQGTDGCSRSARFSLNPGSEADLRLRPDTLIRLGDSLPLTFVTSLADYDTLRWSSSGPLPTPLGNGPIMVRPFSSQSYRLVIEDENGCRAIDDVLIEVNEDADYYVPNAFSPNGDGKNDLFRPFVGPQVREVAAFRVFDRWGEMVYDMEDDPARGSEDFGWDGRYAGERLNPQVLVWQLLVRLVDGREEWETGEVVLLR